MTFDRQTIEALDYLRKFLAVDARAGTQQAFETLDNAGVFSALDEQTDYASAEDILAEAAYDITPVDPAEWGDTTRADMARHQGLGDGRHRRVPVDEPLYGAEAVRMIEALRPKGRFHDCDSIGHLRCSDYRV